MKKPHQLFYEPIEQETFIKQRSQRWHDLCLAARWACPNSPISTTPMPKRVADVFHLVENALFVAFVGSREYPVIGEVSFALAHLRKRIHSNKMIVVVSGGARGVDRASEDAAKGMGIPVLSFKPENDRYHWKAAPMIRNQDIINHSHCTIAFGNTTSGTANSVNLTKKANKPLLWFETKKRVHIDYAIDTWIFDLFDSQLIQECDIIPVPFYAKQDFLSTQETNDLLF